MQINAFIVGARPPSQTPCTNRVDDLSLGKCHPYALGYFSGCMSGTCLYLDLYSGVQDVLYAVNLSCTVIFFSLIDFRLCELAGTLETHWCTVYLFVF